MLSASLSSRADLGIKQRTNDIQHTVRILQIGSGTQTIAIIIRLVTLLLQEIFEKLPALWVLAAQGFIVHAAQNICLHITLALHLLRNLRKFPGDNCRPVIQIRIEIVLIQIRIHPLQNLLGLTNGEITGEHRIVEAIVSKTSYIVCDSKEPVAGFLQCQTLIIKTLDLLQLLFSSGHPSIDLLMHVLEVLHLTNRSEDSEDILRNLLPIGRQSHDGIVIDLGLHGHMNSDLCEDD